MENFFLEIVNTYGTQILGAIFTALAGVVGLALKKLATKWINNEIKRTVARTVVQGVEQLYRHMNGEEKLAKALEAAAEMLQAEGITVTDLELRMLIEAAVGEFNDVFNTADIIMDGIDVDSLDDDQLRELLKQVGFAYADNMTREEMLAALDEAADQANT
jgi:intergrase/recombinase